jgi:hypothetical protein
VCGSLHRPGGDGCSECFWDEDAEAMEKPDQGVRPNYVSFNEARFILQAAGVGVLKRANQAGPKGQALREQFRAMMKDSNAHHP